MSSIQELVANVVENAKLISDASLGHTADAYKVRLNDFEALENWLEFQNSVQKKAPKQIKQTALKDNNFGGALAAYLLHCQSLISEHTKKHSPALWKNGQKEILEIRTGRRYVKVVRLMVNGQESVHSFIDMTNGDVLKPATWRAPAKHARGNIYEGQEDPSKYGVNHFGPMYIR